nr:putative ribonuclease H-like domain-containing protein [Tanacetum cinerariifolium]
LHMDLFGPTFVKSLSKKCYCLVITDDYSRFSWVFFLASKDETTPVLKTFIIGLENLLSLKVKEIRCDNETEFKNSDLNQFCGLKGIKREFSVPRTPHKAFRVFNSRTHFVQETLHVNFMENKLNVAGSGPAWLFDIDSLTRTMNYHLVIAENQTNSHTGLQDTEKVGEEGTHMYVLFPVLSDGSTNSQNNNKDALVDGKEHDDDIQKSVSPDIHSSRSGAQTRKQGDKTENKNKALMTLVLLVLQMLLLIAANSSDMPNLEDLIHSDDADDVGAEADINNLESIISVSPILTTRIHKDHSTSQIIGDLSLTTQTRSMARTVRDQVYQMDVKSGFLYGTIEEEVYVCQPLGFEDPENPDKVYKVVKALYGLHQAPRAWSSGLQVKQKKDGIFISQDKYVAEILRKFGLSEGKSAGTPIVAKKPLLKDSDGKDVDVYKYSQENLSILEGKALLGLMVSK